MRLGEGFDSLPVRAPRARPLAEKYEQYRESPPGVPVVAVDVEEWRAWAAAETDLTRVT